MSNEHFRGVQDLSLNSHGLKTVESGLSIEVEPTPPFAATFFAIDGLGGLGKSSIVKSTERTVSLLVPGCNIVKTAEPPSFPRFEEELGFTPYTLMTERKWLHSIAATAFLAYRRMSCLGASMDGEELTELPRQMCDPETIVLASRSALSSAYQLMAPGFKNPWGGNVFRKFYSDGKVPFPDILAVMFPDDLESQMQRLEERIVKNGGLKDVYDHPDNQSEHLKAYAALLGLINHWPGVYRVISQEIESDPLGSVGVNPSLALSLLISATFIEKGGAEGIWDPYTIDTSFYQRRLRRIGHIATPPWVTAYYIPGYMDKLISLAGLAFSAEAIKTTKRFDEAAIKQTIETLDKGVSYGDVGLLYRDGGLIPIAIEDPSKIGWDKALACIKASFDRGEIEDVTEENRHGVDLHGWSGTRRGWQNISWDEPPQNSY